MRGGRVRASLRIYVLAVVFAVMLGLLGNDGPSRMASAADECADFDGDGFVHVTDQIIFSPWHFFTVPPAPPQLDYNKDGSLTIAAQVSIGSELFSSTTCQTDPLPTTTLACCALEVAANGANPVSTDPAQRFSTVTLGDTF